MSSITTNNIYNGDSWVYVDINQGSSLIINLIFRKIEMKIMFYICDMTSGTKITWITIIVLLSISPPHVQTEIDHDQISGMHTTMPTWSEMYMTNVEIWSWSVVLLEIWETLKTHTEYYPRVIDLRSFCYNSFDLRHLNIYLLPSWIQICICLTVLISANFTTKYSAFAAKKFTE